MTTEDWLHQQKIGAEIVCKDTVTLIEFKARAGAMGRDDLVFVVRKQIQPGRLK